MIGLRSSVADAPASRPPGLGNKKKKAHIKFLGGPFIT